MELLAKLDIKVPKYNNRTYFFPKIPIALINNVINSQIYNIYNYYNTIHNQFDIFSF